MDNEEQAATAPQAPDAIRRRNEDFATLYANNVTFENSIWDLKLIFGELDQGVVPNVIALHTAISIPWIQAKLMSYYLEAQIAIYEADNGRISVPPAVTPPRPDPGAAEVKDNEVAKLVLKFLALLHDRAFAPISRSAVPPLPSEEISPEGKKTRKNVPE